MARRIVVTATGDALITRRLPEYSDDPFRHMADLIRSADVAFTNMEVVLSRYRGLREREFVLAAQAAGASSGRVIFRHIAP